MKKDRIEVAYYSHVRVKNKIFFSHLFLNGLFEINLLNFSVNFIGYFPGVMKTEYCIHDLGQAIQYKNKIYFFPLNCRSIHCYDLESGKIECIDLPMETPIEMDKYFLGTYKWIKKNKVWLFSMELSKGVFIFDLDSESIEKDDMLSDALLKYSTITNLIETPDRKLYTCDLSNNVLIEIDVEEKKIKEYPIYIKNIQIGSINYQNGSFWFIDRCTGEVYEWKTNNQYRSFHIDGEIEWMSMEGVPFSTCHYINNNMYIFPSRSKYVMKIDEDAGLIVKAFDYPKDFYFTDRYDVIYSFCAFGAYEFIDNKILLHPCRGNQILIYDTDLDQITGQELYINTSELFPFEGVMREKERFSLGYLCSGLEKNKVAGIIKEEYIGEKIYEEISSNRYN